MKSSVRQALRVRPGRTHPSDYDTDATPHGPNDKDAAEGQMAETAPVLNELGERLFAEAYADDPNARRLLLVLQGMDTSGKGGVLDHVVGAFGPASVKLTSFKKPTEEERAHNFLWRVRKAVPEPGFVGVFDRSHYEDVLVVRVHDLVPESEWSTRYTKINEFEQELVDSGVVIVKCFLHISYDEQRERLLARLDDPTKHWKFREGDIDERAHWKDYQDAYAAVLAKCDTDAAPWYVVPSDRKWYRNWAIGEILRETLEEMNPQYPETDLDIPRLKARLAPPN